MRLVGVSFIALVCVSLAVYALYHAWYPAVETGAKSPAVDVPWVGGPSHDGSKVNGQPSADLSISQLQKIASDPQQDAEARVQAIFYLAKANDWDSTGILIDLLDDSSLLVRGRAAAAVRQILGTDFYYRAGDDRSQRLEAINGIRRYWQSRAQRPAELHPKPNPE